jgi:hypothetical protein
MATTFRTVQEVLGSCSATKNVTTAMIYTQVLNRLGRESGPHGRTAVLNRLSLTYYAARQRSMVPGGTWHPGAKTGVRE